MTPKTRSVPAEPPFYIATHDIEGPYSAESGVVPAVAFRAGDRVPTELVTLHRWQALVRTPAETDIEPSPGGQREEE
jgi:hypothetical protein